MKNGCCEDLPTRQIRLAASSRKSVDACHDGEQVRMSGREKKSHTRFRVNYWTKLEECIKGLQESKTVHT
jgi:hypothetical protein